MNNNAIYVTKHNLYEVYLEEKSNSYLVFKQLDKNVNNKAMFVLDELHLAKEIANQLECAYLIGQKENVKEIEEIDDEEQEMYRNLYSTKGVEYGM